MLEIAFLTVHFGDIKWTGRLLATIASLKANSRLSVGSIFIVDNARDGSVCKVADKYPACRVVEYPRDKHACEKHGHDHHTSLQRAIREVDCDHLVVLDCDAHLVSDGFLDYVDDIIVARNFDAIVASDPRFEVQGFSHPCFMVLNREARKRELPLDPGLPGNVGQTGRLTRQFLESFDLDVHVPQRERTFSGVLGDIYDGQVYHHGSATFVYSEDSRLTGQARQCERIYAHAVLSGNRYRLTWYEKILVALLSRISRKW